MRALKEFPNVFVFKDPEAVARAVAERFVKLAQMFVKREGLFTVALAGGATPKRTYELLASHEYRDQISWPNVWLFFGDERCVSPGHPASNYRMVNETMLAPLDTHPRVYRMKGEGDPLVNAKLYEETLRSLWLGLDWPHFDLVLLGMGDDGHTASLFPNTPALKEQSAWVVANRVEKLNGYRLTLTAPAINHARHIIFIVAGAPKAEPLAEVVGGMHEPERLPAQLIRPAYGKLKWYVDKPAAAKLRAISPAK